MTKTFVLGFELSEAMRILRDVGYEVFVADEVKSKKGVVGNEKRVIRVVTNDKDKTATISYSVFLTDVNVSGDVVPV